MATLVGMLAALTLAYVSSEPCLLGRPFELTTQGICATDHAAKPWPLISGYSGSGRDQYMEPPGTNHYRLLAHLAQGMATACGARAPHICDVGTNHGDSVRAWISGSPSALVSTFDLNDAPQQIAKLQRKRGGPAATQTPEGVREFFGSNVRFFRGNLLEDAGMFGACNASTLMLLDTLHEPDKQPFEVAFLEKLHGAGYKGLVLLDDMRLNREMKKFWAVACNFAARHGYKAHDLTRVGHYSGTGAIDFSGGRLLSNKVEPMPPARCDCEPATVESCSGPPPTGAARKHCKPVAPSPVRCGRAALQRKG